MKAAIGILLVAQIVLVLSGPIPEDAYSSYDPILKLFTRANPTTPAIITPGKVSEMSVDWSKRLFYVVHGYMDGTNNAWVKNLVAELLTHEDSNVIAVHWSGSLIDWIYPVAAEHVGNVGSVIGSVAVEIYNQLEQKNSSLSPADFICIGHSLGSHVCGFCGKHIFQNTKQKLGKIYAADPAGPLFVGESPETRLDADDALCTVSLNTDQGKFGNKEKICHEHHLINRGRAPQPGCIFYDGTYEAGDFVACSHLRAHDIAIESVNSVGFISTECESYNEYVKGKCKGHAEKVLNPFGECRPGNYVLTTNRRKPFARFGEI